MENQLHFLSTQAPTVPKVNQKQLGKGFVPYICRLCISSGHSWVLRVVVAKP